MRIAEKWKIFAWVMVLHLLTVPSLAAHDLEEWEGRGTHALLRHIAAFHRGDEDALSLLRQHGLGSRSSVAEDREKSLVKENHPPWAPDDESKAVGVSHAGPVIV